MGKQKEIKPVWAGHYATRSEMVKKRANGVALCEDGKGDYYSPVSWVGIPILDPHRAYRNDQTRLAAKHKGFGEGDDQHGSD